MSPADTPAPAMEPLSETELDRLEAKAKGATPGRWALEDPLAPMELTIVEAGKPTHEWRFLASISMPDEDDHDITAREATANAEHIAAFDPPTVLRLIASARRAASGSLPGGAEEPERERVGRAIYMARYGHQGAVWEANESKDVWFAAADRALAPPPPAAEPAVEAYGTSLTEAVVKRDGYHLDVSWFRKGVPQVARVYDAHQMPLSSALADVLVAALERGSAPQPGGAEAKELREAIKSAADFLKPGGMQADIHRRSLLRALDRLAPPPGYAREQVL